jgi:hypothetical protein
LWHIEVSDTATKLFRFFFECRIIRAMKNHNHSLAGICALLLFVILGCSDGEAGSKAAAVSVGDDPAATILENFADRDLLGRTERLISILRAIGPDQVGAFEKALNGLSFPHREIDRVLILAAWSEFDAPAATRWAIRKERSDVVQRTMFSESVYRWAFNDPESFVVDQEVASFAAVGYDSAMLRSFVTGWFDSGTPRLEEFVRNLERGTINRQRAIATFVALKTARDGPAAMIEWMQTLKGDNQYKVVVASHASAQIVNLDSKMATDWCAEICDTPIGKDVPHIMVAAWVRESPEEAMEWIIEQPNGFSTRTGARAAYRHFVVDDRERAAAWMETTTEEERRRRVMAGPIGMYINIVSGDNQPLKAIEWLNYIEEEEFRDVGLLGTLRRWYRRDQAATEEWLAQSSTSDELKAKVRVQALPPNPRR